MNKIVAKATLGLCSVDAYFRQNPLDFIAIMFDIAGDDETAAEIDHINQSI
jgi:hypothetical protein